MKEKNIVVEILKKLMAEQVSLYKRRRFILIQSLRKFRKWINQIAKDYTIKGWVMDDEWLKLQSFMPRRNLKNIA